MGYCKICDLFFIVFCLFVFVLYANPKAFSSHNSVQQAQVQALRNDAIARENAKTEWNEAIWACINKSFRDESDSVIIRHAYHFDIENSTCMDKQWRYDKSDNDDVRYDFTSVTDVSVYSVSGLPDYHLTQNASYTK